MAREFKDGSSMHLFMLCTVARHCGRARSMQRLRDAMALINFPIPSEPLSLATTNDIRIFYLAGLLDVGAVDELLTLDCNWESFGVASRSLLAGAMVARYVPIRSNR